jgi:hypothetical protein
MHLGLLASYWWIVLLAMGAGFLGFVIVAGWSAEGGMRNRVALGWTKWRALSRSTGEFQARAILTAFYFSIAAPFGLGRTYLGDPLRIRANHQTRGWLPRETRDITLGDARRQG